MPSDKSLLAGFLVGQAIKDGRLTRPDTCGRCLKHKPPRKLRNGVVCPQIQAHHDDYDKPLTVEWVCPKCHARITADAAIRKLSFRLSLPYGILHKMRLAAGDDGLPVEAWIEKAISEKLEGRAK